MSDLNQNIAGYLIQRLYDNGVRHIFGQVIDSVGAVSDSQKE
jgi:hypothetical protein